MVPVLVALGVFLVGWGVYVLVSGDFVATLDIAAGLVGTGIVVVALAAVVRSLEHIAQGASRPLADPLRAEAEPKSQPKPQTPPRRAGQSSFTSEPPPPVAPTVVREGDIEGHRYRFYSDGSIEAEGPRGLRRYRSIDEAREQILRDRNGMEESDLRAGRKPEAPRTRPAAAPAIDPADQPYPSRYAVRPPAPGPESEPYIPRYNPPGGQGSPPPPAAEDDEWSEPFRMLLKGEPGGAKSDKR